MLGKVTKPWSLPSPHPLPPPPHLLQGEGWEQEGRGCWGEENTSLKAYLGFKGTNFTANLGFKGLYVLTYVLTSVSTCGVTKKGWGREERRSKSWAGRETGGRGRGSGGGGIYWARFVRTYARVAVYVYVCT